MPANVVLQRLSLTGGVWQPLSSGPLVLDVTLLVAPDSAQAARLRSRGASDYAVLPKATPITFLGVDLSQIEAQGDGGNSTLDVIAQSAVP